MYGLVNKAIEGLICEQAGPAVWEQIKQKAGVDVDYFVSMNPYPDEVSYKLVGAASEVLGLSAEEVLIRFGEYWVLYTAQEGYGDLMAMTGRDFRDFLFNLDNMHAQIGLGFPHLKPPSFRVTEIGPGELTLHYYSERAGLAPMVIGLLNGLGKLMKTTVSVKQTALRTASADHDEFHVSYRPT
ncbi:MAG TPA: heme NO-binding domain-containing protein [Blastocatellia bacterium]|nr:heme NO-binding domain-containing protein [Blastocatellia bacterium]HMV87024.1 heme NO-binding domain-containing protein [Blastocatellia bacterium]HMX25160.1 heme NO-binding domain-containing protein [Blastocatellia bacterium]HMY71865.1 heme NO-binding domain-containing protein [Blastocatellia bacterium]HMZ17693.1 heme NO-binding domain-containing protein [Blastocatellia bacterium]